MIVILKREDGPKATRLNWINRVLESLGGKGLSEPTGYRDGGRVVRISYCGWKVEAEWQEDSADDAVKTLKGLADGTLAPPK